MSDWADDVDWQALGAKLAKIEAVMIHDEQSELRDSAFYGEALRRLLASSGSGFISDAYHMRVLKMNRNADRRNGEEARSQMRRQAEEYAAKLADIRAVMAAAIRARATEHRIPSKYRREGALMVADWLEGKEG